MMKTGLNKQQTGESQKREFGVYNWGNTVDDKSKWYILRKGKEAFDAAIHGTNKGS